MKILELAKKNIYSAYKHNQIIISSFEVGIKPTSKKCFRDGTKITSSLEKKGKNIFLKNQSNMIPVCKGALLRLKPNKTVKYSKNKFTAETKLQRIAFYINNYGAFNGLFRVGNIFLHDIKNRIRYKIKDDTKKSRVDLKFKEGITFRVIGISKDKIKLECYDYGGIYDYFINTEINRYPPQVPENYYATAYFAYNSVKLGKIENNNGLVNAGKMALEFATKNYSYYEPAGIAFKHTDFKYSPLIEAARLLKIKESVKYTESNYNPVNVYALRIHNLVLNEDLEEDLAGDLAGVRRCLKVIRKNQAKDGLIMDNYVPNYTKSKDITYHQFAAACLARAYSIKPLKEVKLILDKAVNFSHNILFENGEVSYYGRGNNNIYHIASAIYLFACYYKISKDKKYISAVQKLYGYLSNNHLTKMYKDWLPTCLNEYSEKMMGWNHCEMPYNMQTSYFLLYAYEILKDKKPNKGMVDIDKSVNKEIFMESGFYHYKNKKYEICIINGGEQLTWANGRHATGIGGIANLTVNNEQKSMSLDFYNNKVPITDLPRIKVNGKFLHPKEYKISRLSKLNNQEDSLDKSKDVKGCTLEVRYKRIRIRKEYSFMKEKIRCNVNCILAKGLKNVEIDGMLNIHLIHLKKEENISFNITENSKEIDMRQEKEKIESNTKGKGHIQKIGFFKSRKVKKKIKLNVVGDYIF